MFGAWEQGDVEAMLEHVAEDADFSPSVWSGAGQTYHGHEGIREWAAQFFGPDRRIEVRATEFRGGPGGVVVIGEVTEIRGELPPIRFTVGWLFEISAGKVSRGEGFSDPARALRVAGVWEA